jgi:catechol 2,3-dioxygenase-like lactoylglutathione lyase family enzyme
MIGFVMVGTNNLDKATKFYDTLLDVIELERVVTNEKYIGYASKEKSDEVEFYVTNPVNKDKATFGNGTQISFLVNSKDLVNNFYNTGIKLGGKDEGAPGIKIW